MAQSATRRAVMKKLGVGLAGIALVCFGFVTSARCGERFSGRFTGEGLTMEANGDQGKYNGTITLGENAFKFTASGKGDGLVGSFTTPDGQFDFHATIKGDKLNLTTGDSHYKLVRLNPLQKGKTSDDTGARITGFVRQQGVGFLGQLVSSVGNSKGQLAESAANAAFGTLSSIGQQLGGTPPQPPSAPVLPGAPVFQVSGAPAQPGTTPPIAANAASANDTHANSLPGTWVKIEQNVVSGVPNPKPTFAAFRSDGSMLMTVNPRTAFSFYKESSPNSPQSDGAPQSTDSDVHARWASNNSSLTISYDGGATAQYAYDIGSNVVGMPVLRLQGGDGSPVQEWTKSN
ncbi:MAG TPA: hypothetical protein VLT36_25245 [Candidatus Dormibacteraeota bacterium]|nr:hypothetical protein [Candidatus Dormibacteraeota bacterium]